MLINPGHNWVPILGTGVMYRHAGFPLHHVADAVLGKRLRDDLDMACDGEPWVACVCFSGGRIAIVPFSPHMRPLPPDQLQKMVDVSILANRELHHGGHWVFAVANGELNALWRDWDGDMHLTQAWPDTWVRLQAMPREEWVEVLEACWTTWDLRVRGIRNPAAQIMRAQGEASKGSQGA